MDIFLEFMKKEETKSLLEKSYLTLTIEHVFVLMKSAKALFLTYF